MLISGQTASAMLDVVSRGLADALKIPAVYWFTYDSPEGEHQHRVEAPDGPLEDYLWPDEEPFDVVPLRTEAAPCQGALVLVGELSTEKAREVRRFTDQLALTLALYQERHMMVRQLENERLIARISQQIGKTFNTEDILNYSAVEIRKHFNSSRCIIFRYDTDNLTQPIAAWGQAMAEEDRPPIDPGDFPVKSVRQRLENMVFQPSQGMASEAEREEIKLLCRKYGILSYMRVYILYRGIPFGQIVLAQSDYNREWLSEEMELVERISTFLGAALYQADLYLKEQQAKEEARSANLRKNQFIASLTHDLRTPLQNIMGGSALLQTQMLGPLNERQGGYIDRINKSGEHLLRMIDDILDIARIEAGRFSISYEAMDIRGWLEHSVALMEPSFRKKSQQITLHFADNVPQWFQGDMRRLSQVMDNLLSNAGKFTPEGRSIHVSSRLDGSYLLVSIQDEGVGIAPADLEIIFKPFERGHHGNSKQEGTGLGLTIAKTIVELHQGSIEATSEPGQGSTFTLRLPLLPSQKLDAN